MKHKQVHITLTFLDFLAFFGLWMLYHEFQRVLVGVNNFVDVIEFSRRVGFLIVFFFVPIAHSVILANHLWPSLSKKYSHVVNWSAGIMIVALLSAGIASSIWIKNQVEMAGYTYCFKASRVSVVTHNAVYTKDMDTCEAIVQKRYKKSENP